MVEQQEIKVLVEFKMVIQVNHLELVKMLLHMVMEVEELVIV